MSHWIQWDIDDPNGENPLTEPATFDFNFRFEYDPGDEEQSASATILGADCTTISFDNNISRPPTAAENKQLEQWVLGVLAADARWREQVEACCVDQMCFSDDAAASVYE